ncbi:MAG: YggS family pyridoxal phosphate-dependent enzyme [Candidatus Omnitrophica bacterium]|nr:YggS family pyridoxal phosphate-dependent enzyme [Candidatus Omnitrophota bacterium]
MIGDNFQIIKKRIFSACERVNRDPQTVTIAAVVKGKTTEQIKKAIEEGIVVVAENKVQEARIHKAEIEKLKDAKIQWHMIGHLQTNKVAWAVRLFDLIHSVDSLRLAEAINKSAEKIGKIQEILLQVKTSDEKTKWGISVGEVEEVAGRCIKMSHLRLRGLMTIAPDINNPEESRSYFRTLKNILALLNEKQIAPWKLDVLSMGMSNDFEVAVEEGATIVRIGRALFA